MSREDQAADAQYQIVLNLLSRKQTTPARHALEQLLQKYPKSKVAPEARDLLAQLPPAEDALPATPAVRTAPASRPARASSPAPAQPQGTPTAEDNAAPEAPRKVVIPSSLMGQKAAPAGAATSPDDNVRVVSSNYNEGALVLNLEYTLASQHTKRVFLGAWMLGESVSRRLGYTATPMAQGRGSSNVTLSDIPPSASSLRVVFFEEGGALFFQKDFTISK